MEMTIALLMVKKKRRPPTGGATKHVGTAALGCPVE
jgi:hypothetical protein